MLSRREILLRAGSVLGAGVALGRLSPAWGQDGERVKGPTVWLGMDQAELDAAYNQRVYAPNMDQLDEQAAQRNEAALARLGEPVEHAYGSAPIETLLIFRTARDDAPIHVFVHGGTWRNGRAAEHAYIAEPFVRAGAHVVIPNFASAAEVDGGLPVLARQVREAVAWTYRNASSIGGDPGRLFVSGFSSGGHLAGVMLTTDWAEEFGLPNDLIRGGLCISGMFDLEPVRLSWRNEYLRLTDDVEYALSPQRQLAYLHAPIIIAYGTSETPEFQRQARDFAAAVEAAGKPVELLVGRGYNHFEMRYALSNPYSLVGHAALLQMGLSTS